MSYIQEKLNDQLRLAVESSWSPETLMVLRQGAMVTTFRLRRACEICLQQKTPDSRMIVSLLFEAIGEHYSRETIWTDVFDDGAFVCNKDQSKDQSIIDFLLNMYQSLISSDDEESGDGKDDENQ